MFFGNFPFPPFFSFLFRPSLNGDFGPYGEFITRVHGSSFGVFIQGESIRRLFWSHVLRLAHLARLTYWDQSVFNSQDVVD